MKKQIPSECIYFSKRMQTLIAKILLRLIFLCLVFHANLIITGNLRKAGKICIKNMNPHTTHFLFYLDSIFLFPTVTNSICAHLKLENNIYSLFKVPILGFPHSFFTSESPACLSQAPPTLLPLSSCSSQTCFICHIHTYM